MLAPWAEIARPSRVQISEVEPGSTEVLLRPDGARSRRPIRGIREATRSTFCIARPTGRRSISPIEMKLEAGGRYECRLPPVAGNGRSPRAPRGGTSITGFGGLLQNVTYRVVAGDAETFPVSPERRRRADDHRRSAGISVSGLHAKSRRIRAAAGRHQGPRRHEGHDSRDRQSADQIGLDRTRSGAERRRGRNRAAGG